MTTILNRKNAVRRLFAGFRRRGEDGQLPPWRDRRSFVRLNRVKKGGRYSGLLKRRVVVSIRPPCGCSFLARLKNER